MSNKKRYFGLIGYPLSHTFSPKYFQEFFGVENIELATYDAFPIQDLTTIRDLLGTIDGLNVTIPYKEEIIPYLDHLSLEAKAIQAVNCIKVNQGKATGYNTDVYGFRTSLLNFLNGEYIRNALILGDGGAAKAVKYVLNQLDITYTTISRTKGDMSYTDLNDEIIRSSRLIINTTPLGMYPNVDNCPNISFNSINESHFLFDLVYNPEKTLFLRRGLAKGAKVKNGFEMLILQAEKSWEIWTNNQTQ